jgi:catalase (peroxidase I)
MKQKLRNAILKDITVAPELVKLAINDALGFEIASGDGGPNGSILFEKDKTENESLKKAIDLVLGVKKEMQRTNTVSLADMVAFAGAEALETVGCSRITVQVGRYALSLNELVGSCIYVRKCFVIEVCLCEIYGPQL